MRRVRSARLGEQPIELMLRERRRRAPGNDEVAELSGLKGPRPDVARVETAIAVLGRTAAHVPLERRPTLLCALAWLHSSIGLGTCADRQLETSSTIDPHHELTAIINAITLTVVLPAWVLDRDLKEATETADEQRQGPNRAARRRR